ncbi:TPA: hypothetical protein N0F65_002228 [Lagenidium giganteum]|uniref:60S ribosomal export protein NMD3 n=1 Tax=Lagenidium giganteum TaxID=4803 RepID=A0AAV2YWI7_9STRA|nr:TPA: hypothetical protein N0F65_002228 [Lagenidium giganteum]
MAILCCVCGVAIEPNAMNMCKACIAKEVDFNEGLDQSPELTQCRGCLRYQPRGGKGQQTSYSGSWVDCPLESAELMALCLKSIHGLHKFKLIDASFIWTEPHSKRIKVKLLLQREVVLNAHIQNWTVVTFVVHNAKCPDCTKQFHNHTWRSLVQIRQKAEHKRTFLRLEQVILKHNAHQDSVGITTLKEGVDFYFGTKSTGERFVSFLSSHVPLRSKVSNKLVSENVKNNTANLQTSYSVEISPICKDDLLLLPTRTAQSCGSIPNLVLCARVTGMIHVVDPSTGQRAEITNDKYWKLPFLPLETSPNMVEFIVLDVEPVEKRKQQQQATAERLHADAKMVLADIEVARVSDFGVNDTTFLVRSHLGSVLAAGDTVKGYDLTNAVFGSRYTYSLKQELPDVLLVRKIFPREKKSKKDHKLKTLNARRANKISKGEAARQQREFEEFALEYMEEQEEEGEGLMEGTHEIEVEDGVADRELDLSLEEEYENEDEDADAHQGDEHDAVAHDMAAAVSDLHLHSETLEVK